MAGRLADLCTVDNKRLSRTSLLQYVIVSTVCSLDVNAFQLADITDIRYHHNAIVSFIVIVFTAAVVVYK